MQSRDFSRKTEGLDRSARSGRETCHEVTAPTICRASEHSGYSLASCPKRAEDQQWLCGASKKKLSTASAGSEAVFAGS